MFTGIIECTTKVHKIYKNKNNYQIIFNNPFHDEIKINQSIAHNGVCLTVVDIHKFTYSVEVSEETLSCTNLSLLKIKDKINVERSLTINDRLNGHIVQGHVDTTSKIIYIHKKNNSYLYFFQSKKKLINIIKKGSISINGVSLTVVNYGRNIFYVSVIPHTYKKTNLSSLKKGDIVNVEFDIFGKYIRNIFREKNNYNCSI